MEDAKRIESMASSVKGDRWKQGKGELAAMRSEDVTRRTHADRCAASTLIGAVQARVRRIVVVREVSSSYRARACAAPPAYRVDEARAEWHQDLTFARKAQGVYADIGSRRRGERAQRAVSGGLGFPSGEIGLDDECGERSAIVIGVAQTRSGQQRSMRT